MPLKKLLIVLLLLVAVAIWLSLPRESTPSRKGRCNFGGGAGVGIANPAAVYCESLGYQYRIVKGDKGEYGVCAFPDGSECEEWAFFRGECGTKWSYCERFCGGKIVPQKADSPFASKVAACELKGTLYPDWKLCAEGACESGG